MSKEKPEVGDVWYDKMSNQKIVFIMVSDYYCEYIEHYEKLTESFEIYTFTTGTNEWKKGMKYLGKSKANINDLFEVQDD